MRDFAAQQSRTPAYMYALVPEGTSEHMIEDWSCAHERKRLEDCATTRKEWAVAFVWMMSRAAFLLCSKELHAEPNTRGRDAAR